jgi:hypothetical protein
MQKMVMKKEDELTEVDVTSSVLEERVMKIRC